MSAEIRKVTLYPSINWIDSEEEIETEVIGSVEIIVDHAYGADADGNRGESREFIDEVLILKLRIKFPGRPWISLPVDDKFIEDQFTLKEYNSIIDDLVEKVWEE
jgi:hypothetical protein